MRVIRLLLLATLLLCPRWLMADSPMVIPLWEAGPPGFEALRHEPERAQDWWVRNIHYPTLTAFLPDPARSTGAAVIICPGGGHRELVFEAEGARAAQWFAERGIAAFALKYRLGRETGSPYRVPEHARQDGIRALQVVRSRAAEWQIDAGRIGMMGFSAGGEVVAFVTYAARAGNPQAADPVERVSARPDFQILIYPGPAGIPEQLPADTPPAFLLAAVDDRQPAQTLLRLTDEFRRIGVPVELHLYARGGHAFNLGERSPHRSINRWLDRLEDWLLDSGYTTPRPPAE
jgi:acetyl esterase/lipase